jgi:hypothetical protein
MTPTRTIHVRFQKDWLARERRGLLATDPRVRTLCKVLVTYPDVRHIVSDRISLHASADPRTLDSVVRFLERQAWLVESLVLE